MKINIEEIEGFGETEINIKCESVSSEILEFINEYKLLDTRIWGVLEKESYIDLQSYTSLNIFFMKTHLVLI